MTGVPDNSIGDGLVASNTPATNSPKDSHDKEVVKTVDASEENMTVDVKTRKKVSPRRSKVLDKSKS